MTVYLVHHGYEEKQELAAELGLPKDPRREIGGHLVMRGDVVDGLREAFRGD